MLVRDLITELEVLDPIAWVDATFGQGDAFAVTGTDTITLPDGRVIALINIVDGVPLKGVG